MWTANIKISLCIDTNKSGPSKYQNLTLKCHSKLQQTTFYYFLICFSDVNKAWQIWTFVSGKVHCIMTRDKRSRCNFRRIYVSCYRILRHLFLGHLHHIYLLPQRLRVLHVGDTVGILRVDSWFTPLRPCLLFCTVFLFFFFFFFFFVLIRTFYTSVIY